MSVMKSALQEEIVGKLAKIVAPEYVTTDESRLDELSWDALSEGRLHPAKRPDVTSPLCSVLPSSTDEVRQVVLLANQEKIPIIPYGGGSGLMGGALSVQAGIVVDLRRMDQILDVDTEARSARVQAGTVLERLEKRLNREVSSLVMTLDIACSHGGRRDFHQQHGVSRGLYGSMGSKSLGWKPCYLMVKCYEPGPYPSRRPASISSRFSSVAGLLWNHYEATIRIFPHRRARASCTQLRVLRSWL
jgi:FAD/FMN-containing dehydrogenase